MSSLLLADDATLTDLATYVGRAHRVDPGGAIRLMARGEVLAAYVSPVHGGGGPTVIGLRVLQLTQGADVDTTVALAALTDRFARLPTSAPGVSVELAVPPAAAVGVTWAGMSPPRSGWQVLGAIAQDLLLDAARQGIEEVAAGAPDGAGAAAVAQLRGRVWGRDLPGVVGVPTGAAYAAQALGFIGADEPLALFSSGAWRRLTTSRGHVLTRTALL